MRVTTPLSSEKSIQSQEIIAKKQNSCLAGPAERIFEGGGGGLMRIRKRGQTRGVRGHASPGKFEILSLLKELEMYLKLQTIIRIFVYQIQIKQRVTN